MYFHINSKDCLSTHPQNIASDFTVDLPEPIHFHEKWEIGLTEIMYKGKSVGGDVYVYCDICETSVINGKRLPILRIIRKAGEIFNVPYYIPISQKTISGIRVYIRDSDYDPISFSKRVLRCTLHIRKSRR